MVDKWIILFRRGDTWEPGVRVYDTKEHAYEAAENFSHSGQTVLVQHVVEFPGRSCTGAIVSRIV